MRQQKIDKAAREREFQITTHHATLKMLNGADPVAAVVRTCGFESGAVAYAKEFWHRIFQDFWELRKIFPAYAARFEPYEEKL